MIIMHAIYVRNANIRKKPYYKYYIPGVLCKLLGGTLLCMVYTYYYDQGGDTTNYFLGAKTFVNVLFDANFPLFFDMINFFSNDIQTTGYQDYEYGNIYFGSSDFYALFTVVLSIPFCVLAFKSFVAMTMLLAYASFYGLWKLYQVFIDQFPELTRQFAIAIFFIPSVFFWGSGLLKDTYTLSALGFYTYSVFKYIIKKERKFKYLITIVLSSLLIVFVKPYIFFAALPGSLIWMFFNRIARIKSPLAKTLVLPIMLVAMFGLIAFVLSFFGQFLGEYSLDRVLDKAVKTQQDLVHNEQYSTNSHNIGEFEATIPGVLSKAPAAINMALFRPYLWNARNPVMVLSGLENLFTLCFSIYIVIKVKFTTLFKSLFSHPLLVFSFLFALFFAFSVGLTTANYGALVRLKIPCVPFYLSSLFILFHLNKSSFKRSMF